MSSRMWTWITRVSTLVLLATVSWLNLQFMCCSLDSNIEEHKNIFNRETAVKALFDFHWRKRSDCECFQEDTIEQVLVFFGGWFIVRKSCWRFGFSRCYCINLSLKWLNSNCATQLDWIIDLSMQRKVMNTVLLFFETFSHPACLHIYVPLVLLAWRSCWLVVCVMSAVEQWYDCCSDIAWWMLINWGLYQGDTSHGSGGWGATWPTL